MLGAIHLSTGKQNHLAPLFNAVREDGFNLVGVFSSPVPGKNNPLDGIRSAPGGAVNAVVSTSGLALAEKMYNDFGIPFVTGMPVGLSGRDNFLAMLHGRNLEFQLPGKEKTPYRHALVIGEPVLGYGVAHCLRYDFGLPRVDVISVTPSEPLFRESMGRTGLLAERGQGDVDTDEEGRISDLMNAPDVDLIVADPCYQALLAKTTAFIPLPHVAMSARIHWDMDYEYAVDQGYAYLSSHLMTAP